MVYVYVLVGIVVCYGLYRLFSTEEDYNSSCDEPCDHLPIYRAMGEFDKSVDEFLASELKTKDEVPAKKKVVKKAVKKVVKKKTTK